MSGHMRCTLYIDKSLIKLLSLVILNVGGYSYTALDISYPTVTCDQANIIYFDGLGLVKKIFEV